MISMSPRQRRQIKRFASLLAISCLVPFYQNCGEFKSLAPASTDFASGFSPDSDSSGGAGVDGKALYTANCAACHGVLASSTKLGKLAPDITSAIANVQMMKSQIALSSLSQVEIKAIEDALNGRLSGTAPGATPSPITETPVGICSPNAVRGISKEAVRRLSRDELKASMKLLIPDLAETLEANFNFYPDTDVVEEVEKYDPLHSQAQVLQWAETVDFIADSVAQRGLMSRIADACMQQASITEACWRGFFTNFGKKVYRRPLQPDEIDKLTALSMSRGNGADAVYAAFHMLLRSPAFLFHFEKGVSEDAQRVRLSDYEVANRISFAILGSPPDAQLLAAADRSELKTSAQVEAQVRRLVDSDGAKLKLKKFFSEWLQLSKVQSPQQEYMVFFKELGGSAGMDQAMRTEIQDYLFHIFWKTKGTFKDLMTAPIAFPRFQGLYYSKGSKPFSALSGIYGEDLFANFTPENQVEATPFPAPFNPGLLTRAGFLSSTRWETQPIAKGVFVQRRILCEQLPSPDFTVVNQRLNDVGTLDPLVYANHEIVSQKTNGVSCISCHAKINPVGFALEGFDMMGKARVKEQVLDVTKFYSEKHGVMAEHALLTPVNKVLLGEKTVTVTSAADLAQQVATSTRAKLCLSTFVLRHFDRRKENGGDSCLLTEATQIIQNDQPVLNLFVKSLANEDIFWRRK